MWKALMVAAVLGGCASQPAVFRDTLKPGGVERGQAQLSIDSSACDFATNALRPGIHFDMLHTQCMGGKGWALSGR
jgi:hypothetical protein